MVMATQNPLDHDATFTPPEAQLDRFLLHVEVSYPSAKVEHQILELAHLEAPRRLQCGVTSSHERAAVSMTPIDVNAAHQAVLYVHLAAQLKAYIVELVLATRQPEAYATELCAS
jgi:MoxR-like ATPase